MSLILIKIIHDSIIQISQCGCWITKTQIRWFKIKAAFTLRPPVLKQQTNKATEQLNISHYKNISISTKTIIINFSDSIISITENILYKEFKLIINSINIQ